MARSQKLLVEVEIGSDRVGERIQSVVDRSWNKVIQSLRLPPQIKGVMPDVVIWTGSQNKKKTGASYCCSITKSEDEPDTFSIVGQMHVKLESDARLRRMLGPNYHERRWFPAGLLLRPLSWLEKVNGAKPIFEVASNILDSPSLSRMVVHEAVHAVRTVHNPEVAIRYLDLAVRAARLGYNGAETDLARMPIMAEESLAIMAEAIISSVNMALLQRQAQNYMRIFENNKSIPIEERGNPLLRGPYIIGTLAAIQCIKTMSPKERMLKLERMVKSYTQEQIAHEITETVLLRKDDKST